MKTIRCRDKDMEHLRSLARERRTTEAELVRSLLSEQRVLDEGMLKHFEEHPAAVDPERLMDEVGRWLLIADILYRVQEPSLIASVVLERRRMDRERQQLIGRLKELSGAVVRKLLALVRAARRHTCSLAWVETDEGMSCRACQGRAGEHKLGCLVYALQCRFRVTGLGELEDDDRGTDGFVCGSP